MDNTEILNAINQNLMNINTNLKSIFNRITSVEKKEDDNQILLMNMSNDMAYFQQQIDELKNQKTIEKSNNNFEIY